VWQNYWTLNADPFRGPRQPFVPTSSHVEAVARLVDVIESGERLAVVRGRTGLGKSIVLEQAVKRTSGPARRAARVVNPIDGAELFGRLAEGLGVRIPPASTRSAAWRALRDGIRICRLQKIHVVLVLDNANDLTAGPDRNDLERLAHVDAHPSARFTVLLGVREPEESAPPSAPAADWRLAIRLLPMTRSETDRYVSTKLAAAGRTRETFAPRAISRLHALSGGSPRGVDRLATLALMAGAVRGLEVVTPDVVDGVALECEGPWPEFFAA
jgi:type II secretory pathway predicted ATPase ExeA